MRNNLELWHETFARLYAQRQQQPVVGSGAGAPEERLRTRSAGERRSLGFQER